jgi:hypothetical protein
MPRAFEKLQLVVFAPGVWSKSALDFWNAAPPLPIAGFQNQGPGVSYANGTDTVHQLTLQLQPGRADIQITGDPDLSPGPQQPTFADLSVGLGLALPLAKAIAKVSNSSRLAVIAVAAEDFSTVDDAMVAMDGAVPNLPRTKNATEQHFQVNSRLPSVTSPSTQINRNCRWYAQQRFMLSLQIGQLPAGIAFAPGAIPPTASPVIIFGQQLDLNTDPNLPIDATQTDALFDELIGELELILRVGHVHFR